MLLIYPKSIANNKYAYYMTGTVLVGILIRVTVTITKHLIHVK